jgi:nucleotide-binding universal stress UspA family protein
MPAQPDQPIVALVAFDGSAEAAAAIRAASRLLAGARVVVMYASGEPAAAGNAALARIAVPDSIIAGSVATYEREAEQAAERLAEHGRELAEALGLEAMVCVDSRLSPWRAICHAAVENEADVIVCGTRGRGGIARAFLGSILNSLVHHSPRPVLVVPPGGNHLSGPLLIAYDGSDGARSAIRTAARLLPTRSALIVTACRSDDVAASGLGHNADVPTLIVRGP